MNNPQRMIAVRILWWFTLVAISICMIQGYMLAPAVACVAAAAQGIVWLVKRHRATAHRRSIYARAHLESRPVVKLKNANRKSEHLVANDANNRKPEVAIREVVVKEVKDGGEAKAENVLLPAEFENCTIIGAGKYVFGENIPVGGYDVHLVTGEGYLSIGRIKKASIRPKKDQYIGFSTREDSRHEYRNVYGEVGTYFEISGSLRLAIKKAKMIEIQ